MGAVAEAAVRAEALELQRRVQEQLARFEMEALEAELERDGTVDSGRLDAAEAMLTGTDPGDPDADPCEVRARALDVLLEGAGRDPGPDEPIARMAASLSARCLAVLNLGLNGKAELR
jgi:hypothetical protein